MKSTIRNKTIAICGAGIGGVAAAYYLSKINKDWKIILIDKNLPLSFTTSKSGENFRDYWPHECMEQLCSRSITLMEDLRKEYGDDSFQMTFSGSNNSCRQNNHSSRPLYKSYCQDDWFRIPYFKYTATKIYHV